MWVFSAYQVNEPLKHSTESQSISQVSLISLSLLGECCDDQENIINLLTMLLQIIWNFLMNRNESFYFRISKKTEMVCSHLFCPSPQDATSTSSLRRACFPPAVSITAESFPELHPGVASWAPAGCAAAGDALEHGAVAALGHLPFPWEHAPPTSSRSLLHLSQPLPSMLHPWYSVLFACNMRL